VCKLAQCIFLAVPGYAASVLCQPWVHLHGLADQIPSWVAVTYELAKPLFLTRWLSVNVASCTFHFSGGSAGVMRRSQIVNNIALRESASQSAQRDANTAR